MITEKLPLEEEDDESSHQQDVEMLENILQNPEKKSEEQLSRVGAFAK